MENQSSTTISSPVKCCCPSTSTFISHDSTSLPLLSLGNPFTLSAQTLGGPEFFPGCRVLARREVDGLYYLGTVIQQVQGRGGVWVVQFDHPGGAGSGFVSSQRQLVCSPDMVKDVRAHICCLVPADAVLSPWEPDLRRYGPGRVMAATEHRDSFGVDVKSLRVLMWNGCVSLVPGSLVLPISAPQHARIVRELQIPTSASSRCCSWLCARSSSCPPQLFCPGGCQSSSCCCSYSNPRPCLFPLSCRSSFGGTDGFERAEQDKQLDLKNTDVGRRDPEVPSPSSSSSLSEDEDRVKPRSKQQRPPWRYWRQTGSEPQHRQPGPLVPRRTSQPARSSFPVPQIGALPNHSSLFQSLPGAEGRRANIKDVFVTTNFKPRPPAALRPFSCNTATSVST
ncbi:uncharacterized protein C11orf16 homolog [Etheostoma spectabile]|uniref:uncharacterized protein C11orf16 homolog n=1 Tax=Etheostoma spectabile TaxID=54343 RepID=UPI0013AFBBA2|nr:uncharacterized protein C11orf16 homolog [Etheostoma spectabile]